MWSSGRGRWRSGSGALLMLIKCPACVFISIIVEREAKRRTPRSSPSLVPHTRKASAALE